MAELRPPIWQCLPFAEVPALTLYRALALRSSVFVVEQQCLYQDLDGSDPHGWLVIGSLEPADAVQEVIATARMLAPGLRFAEPSIGRVCTAASHRRQGLGKLLMTFAIQCTRERHPGLVIRISAQAYLQAFYEALGFEAASPFYLEDGIGHVEMLLPPGKRA